MADCHQPRVVNLLADYSYCAHECLPRGIDVGRFKNHLENRFKGRCLRFCVRHGQSKTVCDLRPGGDIAEFDEVLRCDLENLAASVQLNHCMICEAVGRIGSIC